MILMLQGRKLTNVNNEKPTNEVPPCLTSNQSTENLEKWDFL